MKYNELLGALREMRDRAFSDRFTIECAIFALERSDFPPCVNGQIELLQNRIAQGDYSSSEELEKDYLELRILKLEKRLREVEKK